MRMFFFIFELHREAVVVVFIEKSFHIKKQTILVTSPTELESGGERVTQEL